VDPKQRLRARLDLAKRHVEKGNAIVLRQGALIEKRKAAGYDTADAERLLDQFLHTLSIFQQDWDDIRTELDQLDVS